MSTVVLLLVVLGAIVGLGLLAVGIWWRSGGKAVRTVLIVVGALMALANVGLIGALVFSRTTN
jgi:hypothetical protein